MLWPETGRGPAVKPAGDQRLGPQSFGSEKQQAKTGHGEMCAHGRDEQHQDGSFRERLEGDAIEIGAHGRHDRDRQERLRQRSQLQRRQPPCERNDHERGQHIEKGEAPRELQRKALAVAPDLDGQRQCRKHDQQPRRAWQLAEVEHGQRQRAVGDEFALRHQDDARDREHQHQRKRKQRVDRTVGDAVLQQKEEDGGIQGARSGAAGYEGCMRSRLGASAPLDAQRTQPLQTLRENPLPLAPLRPQRHAPLPLRLIL